MKSLLALLLALSISSSVHPCFITNCVSGGKRSVLPPGPGQIKECQTCGPAGLGGHCYGPSICCSPLFGCLIGSPETMVCQKESMSSRVCKPPGPFCRGDLGVIQGQCGAEKICCSPDTCTRDETCHFPTKGNALFRKFAREFSGPEASGEPDVKDKDTRLIDY